MAKNNFNRVASARTTNVHFGDTTPPTNPPPPRAATPTPAPPQHYGFNEKYHGIAGDPARDNGPIQSKTELFALLEFLLHNPGYFHHARNRLGATDTTIWPDPTAGA